MKQYKYGVIGRFAFGKQTFGGQSIKTKNFTDELEKMVGEENVLRIDTHGWKKHPVKLIKNIRKTIAKCEQVIILPADRGVLVIPRLVKALNRFKKRKLHYVVVGGWLQSFTEKYRALKKTLLQFDGIYVETSVMKRALEEQGFKNIVVFPNFKALTPLCTEELLYNRSEPYKLCTFSRIMKEKGIEDVINSVKKINSMMGRCVYTLDIYGKVDTSYVDEFESLCNSFPDYIKYGGIIDSSKSTDIIKNYFALVFPTKYYTEGIPGTIIDAYFAGVPVISSKWESFCDVVDDGVTGIGYKFDDADELTKTLITVLHNPERMNDMKENCLKKAIDFTPEEIIKIFAKGK